jgi:photosystem II stability/assembly factor-like uncharacterized protein
MKFLFRSLILLLLATPALSQWQAVHPSSPIHRSFYRVLRPGNSQQFYAIGKDLAISSDEGRTWSLKPGFQLPVSMTDSDLFYFDAVFSSANVGYWAKNNQIFKTADQGVSWTKVLELQPNHSKYKSSAYFQALHFLNDQVGYAVGDFDKIFRTRNGGLSWDTLRWSNRSAPFIRYSDVHFLNEQEGFVSGFEVDDAAMNFGFTAFVMKTTDAGRTWSRTVIPTKWDHSYTEMHVLSSDTLFVHLHTSQTIDETYRSTNGGKTWTLNSPPSFERIRRTYWLNAQVGLIFGKPLYGTPQLLRTEDGGQSWTPTPLPIFPDHLESSVKDIHFLSENRGVLAGAGGSLVYTADQGRTWQSSNQAFPDFFSLGFISPTTGFASSGLGFYKTEDSGASWQFQPQSDSMYIFRMAMVNANQGFFYGFRNFHYHVSQGGRKVEAVQLPVTFTYDSRTLIRDDTVYTAGYSRAPKGNVLLKSGDWGKTWQTQPIVSEDNPIVDFELVDRNHLYLATSISVRKSDDGGKTWDKVLEHTNDYVTSIVFLNADTGFAALLSGKVVRTTNQGHSWEQVSPFSTETSVTEFLAVSPQQVFAYGSKKVNGNTLGAIWKSADGGQNWQEETLPIDIDSPIRAMTRAGQSVYATGGYGQILRLTLSPEVVTGQEPSESDQSLVLFPVPAEDYLRFTLPGLAPVQTVDLIHPNGKSYLNLSCVKENDAYLVTLPATAAGLYVLRVQSAKGVFHKRLIIK